MLESNRIPLRTLNRAIELYGERYLLRQLDIHEKTIYRWRTGRGDRPGAAVRRHGRRRPEGAFQRRHDQNDRHRYLSHRLVGDTALDLQRLLGDQQALT